VAAGHDVVLALTQPDRPAGRGLRLIPSPVKRFAASHGIRVLQPANLRIAQDVDSIRALRPDALVVAAYGLLLPQVLLDAGTHGALNIHASLLPRWRGAAPIQRAILAGDRETGISIMQMDAGLDTGPVLAQRKIAIDAEDDAGSLRERLAELGADMIVQTLADVAAGRARAVAQLQTGVTHAPKISKDDTRLDWRRAATQLERAVRAFRPVPGALTTLEGEPIKIWRARVVDVQLPPGTLTPDLVVGCGQDALEVLELQRAGGKKLPATQFLRGRPLPPQARFA
jgi:methionyl-tRNA formyltransferase